MSHPRSIIETTAAAAPLTQTEQDDIETAFQTALDAVTPEERKNVMKRIERAEERKKGGDKVTPAVAESRARACAIASRFLIAVTNGMTPTEAAWSIGADLKRDWGRINGALLDNPKLMLLWRIGRDSVGRRLIAKAAGVVESALDGAPVDKSAARLAGFVLDRGGFFGGRDTASGRAAPTAAAQVVINLGGIDAAKSCCNLLQRAKEGVING